MRRGGASVRLEGIAKRYDHTTALGGVDLEVHAGEFFTLLGPSGSGKTTTLMIVAGFIDPTAGEVVLDGRPVTAWPSFRRGLGMVFQHYSLFPHMTVAKNIAFPLEVRRTPRLEIQRRVAEMLDLVRLTGMDRRYPRQLSGGQQQRVALARALVYEPRVLLMDEPLGALDKNLREAMQLEIKRIQARLGITVLYVTHDQEEALTMSDRIAVMRDGHVEQIGRPDELYEYPANRFVAGFIGESNFLEGTVAEAGDDTVMLRLADATGLVPCRPGPAPRLTPGQAVTLAVRPEKLGFAPEGTGGLAGEIAEVIYGGDLTKYVVRTAGGSTLVVEEQNRGPRHRHAAGASVVVTWAPDDGRLLA